jgi:hypothetical protein
MLSLRGLSLLPRCVFPYLAVLLLVLFLNSAVLECRGEVDCYLWFLLVCIFCCIVAGLPINRWGGLVRAVIPFDEQHNAELLSFNYLILTVLC